MSTNGPPPDFRLTGYDLVLREWTEADLPAMVELFDDPDIAYRTPLAAPFDLAAARDHLRQARRAHTERQRLQLAITTDGRQAKGEVRLSRARGTISYVVGSAHRGRRLAARALTLMTEHAHRELALRRVLLEIESDNHPSIAVAKAAGFHRTGAKPDVVTGERRTFTLFTWAHDAP